MDKDRVILGAGLSGLSAAYHGGGFVYEKENKVGGTCISPRVDRYIFDLGIHVLHTRNEYVLDLLINRLKCAMQLKKRSAWIYSGDVMTKYPFQVNTFGLPETIKKDCIEGFKEVCNKANTQRYHKNYEDWIYSKFGKGIAEHFYLPYSEKFWTVPAREMTTDWLDIRVPLPSLREVIEGSRRLYRKEYGPNAMFRYPLKGGIAKLPEAFLPKIANKVFLGKEARKLSLNNKSIIFKDGSTLSYKSLISTIPIPQLFVIIEDEIPSNVINAVKGLKCNSILCVNLGIKKSKIHASHWIYYPEKEYSFFRISFPKNFSNRLAPDGRSSVAVEISYSDYKPIDKRNIIDIVTDDLIRARILRKKDIVEVVDIRDVRYGYPIYDHSRRENVRIVKDYLGRFDIYLAGRYGKWEYQWMDDAILDGKRAAEEIKKK